MARTWVQPLVELGMSELEAEVYGALVGESPVTGYRVAQLVGKPVANVYKALRSLEGKGAVVVDPGGKRLSRAVPPRELLQQMDERFADRRRRAAQALADIPQAKDDDRVYQLSGATQVFGRARAMARRAKRIVLADAGGGPLARIASDLGRTAARGVEVAVRTEDPIEIDGVRVIAIPERGSARAEPWPSDWMVLVIDGREVLLALFAPDGRRLVQALWSGSPFLAWVFHSGLGAELALDLVWDAAASGRRPRWLTDVLTAGLAFLPADAPGRRQLLAAVRAAGAPIKKRRSD
jgi:predicted transcriptional regulator